VLQRLVLVGAVAVLAIGSIATRAQAHHAQVDPQGLWGYLWSNYDYYPNRSTSASYKAWTVSGAAVPGREQLLIIDTVDGKWEPPLNYGRAAGGYPTFNFFVVNYNQTTALKFLRMDTDDQVHWLCGATAAACFVAESYLYDSSRQRREVTVASFVYGPNVAGGSDLEFEHDMAHEFGHMFGLAHHTPCGYVMSTTTNCTNLPDSSDVATTLQYVYGFN
jgi:hypothetical protein